WLLCSFSLLFFLLLCRPPCAAPFPYTTLFRSKMLCQHPVAQLRGRLRVIFTANALAAEVERRNSWIDSPNPIDLDGVFPGNKDGSHTDRMAATIAHLLADSDADIDCAD